MFAPSIIIFLFISIKLIWISLYCINHITKGDFCQWFSLSSSVSRQKCAITDRRRTLWGCDRWGQCVMWLCDTATLLRERLCGFTTSSTSSLEHFPAKMVINRLSFLSIKKVIATFSPHTFLVKSRLCEKSVLWGDFYISCTLDFITWTVRIASLYLAITSLIFYSVEGTGDLKSYVYVWNTINAHMTSSHDIMKFGVQTILIC